MSSPMYELPDHCPISVTEDGRGPAFGVEAHRTLCWCGDLTCMEFYGQVLTKPQEGRVDE